MKHAIVVFVLAFGAGVLLYPAYLSLLVRGRMRQHVAEYGPATHRAKEGTPTLGGALFCAVAVVAWLVFDRSREGVLAIFALLGGAAIAAFAVYNWHPARLFMGDTGSLALGCVMVALSAEVHLLWLLPLLGIVFVVEALSVVINVTAIRRYGRRVLRASPLHHHFEEMGLREQRLVGLFALAAAAGTLLTVLYARFQGPAG